MSSVISTNSSESMDLSKMEQLFSSILTRYRYYCTSLQETRIFPREGGGGGCYSLVSVSDQDPNGWEASWRLIRITGFDLHRAIIGSSGGAGFFGRNRTFLIEIFYAS